MNFLSSDCKTNQIIENEKKKNLHKITFITLHTSAIKAKVRFTDARKQNKTYISLTENDL